ncbi:MAG: DMT family transporter [Chloroflexota bacterium]
MNEKEQPRFGPIDLALLAMVIIWAANFSIIKAAMGTLAPLPFNAIRFSAATAIVLFIAAAAGENWRVNRADAGRLVLLGLVGTTAYQLLFINGIARTTAGNSSLMLGSIPVYVSLTGTLTGLERLGWQGWLGCLLAFGGIALVVVGSGQNVDVSGESVLGTLLVLGGAVAWAVYTVLSRPLLSRHSSLKVTSLSMLAGTPVLVLVALPQWHTQQWTTVPWQEWAGMAYSAVMALGVAYVIWNTGVKIVGSTRTAIYSNLQPVVAMLIGWLWLDEHLGWMQVIGAAIIVTGVLLTRSSNRSIARRAA